jgi:hypothetical protein
MVVRNKAWIETHWGDRYVGRDRTLLQGLAHKLSVQT